MGDVVNFTSSDFKIDRISMRLSEDILSLWAKPPVTGRRGRPEQYPVALIECALSLATGLRCFNVTHLEWTEIDSENQHAWVHPDQAKGEKAIPVPLNANAIAILKRWQGQHPQFVFVYKGKPIRQCSTKAWRKALTRAKIKNFRWHDLRHTWASWDVQHGTSLHELQQLGGWRSYDMVLRYAHLGGKELKQAADRVHVVTNWLQSQVSGSTPNKGAL